MLGFGGWNGLESRRRMMREAPAQLGFWTPSFLRKAYNPSRLIPFESGGGGWKAPSQAPGGRAKVETVYINQTETVWTG